MIPLAAIRVLLACADDDAGELGPTLTVEFGELVTTLMTVRWTTERPSKGLVRYGVVGEGTFETPPEQAATTEHEVVVLGMPVDSEVELRGVDDAGVVSEALRVTTGGVPSDWPAWTVTADQSTWDGWIVSAVSGATTGAFVMDPKGRVVWWWMSDADNLRVLRAIPSADGTSIIVSRGGDSYADGTEIAQFGWTGELLQTRAVEDMTHDFVQRPDGHFTAIVQTRHERGEIRCIVGGIAEFEWEQPTDLIWDGWDEYGDVNESCVGESEGLTHFNALDWDEDRGEYILSSRNLNTLSVIDRQSATMVESYGEYGTIIPADADSAFTHQHQFQRLDDDRFLVFDDGDAGRNSSRVNEVVVDRAAGVYRTEWKYAPDPNLYVYALGDVERLENGNTLSNWSTSGRIEEVTPTGESVWRIELDLGQAFGYMQRVDSLYP